MNPIVALSVLCSTAQAVPIQYTHQGRLLDADGVPFETDVEITFRLMDAESGGTTVWEEVLTISTYNGFYSALLGTDIEDNPLDTEVWSQAPIWLEIQLSGADPMAPRTAVNSVPYANMALVAEEVTGGPVDASEVRVAGSLVIDAAGAWVGPASSVSWSALEDVPSGFADGDDADSLATMVCLDGEVMVYSIVEEAWTCGTDGDTTLTAAEVQAVIEAVSGLSLLSGATVGGSDVLTHADHAADADAHHSSTSDGLDITPASVTIQGTDTVLTDGSIDLGPSADDALTAAMVQTLTGGGEADSLHSHAGSAARSGGCYTAFGTAECAAGFEAVLTGAPMTQNTLGGSPICMDKSNLLLNEEEPSTSRSFYAVNSTGYIRYDPIDGEMACAVCCGL